MKRTPRPRWIPVVVFLLPIAAILLVFRVAPLVFSGWISLTQWNGITDPRFVGLANYERALSDERLIKGLMVNITCVAGIVASLVLSYVVATLLHARLFGWRFFRVAYVIPTLLSPIVVGLYWRLFLSDDGPLDIVSTLPGLGFLDQNWLSEPGLAVMWLVLILVWSTFGLGVVIFVSALADLNQETLDAARIDGPSWYQLQRHVVIPQVSAVGLFWMIVLIITAFTGLLRVVDALTRGGPGGATSTLENVLIRQLFGLGAFGYGAAVGLLSLAGVVIVVGILLTIVARREAELRA